jgi:hypothetical protein
MKRPDHLIVLQERRRRTHDIDWNDRDGNFIHRIKTCRVPGDALSRLCNNHMPAKENKKPAHKRHQAFMVTIETKHRIPEAI